MLRVLLSLAVVAHNNKSKMVFSQRERERERGGEKVENFSSVRIYLVSTQIVMTAADVATVAAVRCTIFAGACICEVHFKYDPLSTFLYNYTVKSFQTHFVSRKRFPKQM